MRAVIPIAILSLAGPLLADKLSLEDRIELTRGLMAEYATVKVLLPRAKKALEYDAPNQKYDKKEWDSVAKEYGPAARNGDLVQITKIVLENDRILLEINGGFKGGRKWYQGVQVGVNNGPMQPVSTNDSNAPGGTSIVLLFHKPLEPIKAAEVKKMLAPVLDFEKHTVTENYTENLPPEVQKAIKDKHIITGMNREQVILALGRPDHHSREMTPDGYEVEDWVYGKAPGKFTFVTFKGEKVIKVKEAYAGLGTQVEQDRPIR